MDTSDIHIHWQTRASMAAWPWESPHRSHILHIQTHMVGGKQRVWGIQTGRQTEKERQVETSREREREWEWERDKEREGQREASIQSCIQQNIRINN